MIQTENNNLKIFTNESNERTCISKSVFVPYLDGTKLVGKTGSCLSEAIGLVELSSEPLNPSRFSLIEHHADMRSLIFYNLLLIFYNSKSVATIEKTKLQYGVGNKKLGLEAAHSSLLTHVSDSCSILKKENYLYHLMNTTVTLPTLLNQLDARLEKELRSHALSILNSVSKGEILPEEGLKTLIELMHNFFVTEKGMEETNKSKIQELKELLDTLSIHRDLMKSNLDEKDESINQYRKLLENPESKEARSLNEYDQLLKKFRSLFGEVSKSVTPITHPSTFTFLNNLNLELNKHTSRINGIRDYSLLQKNKETRPPSKKNRPEKPKKNQNDYVRDLKNLTTQFPEILGDSDISQKLELDLITSRVWYNAINFYIDYTKTPPSAILLDSYFKKKLQE